MSNKGMSPAVSDIMNDKSLTQSEKDRLALALDPKAAFLEYLATCVTSLTNKSKFFEDIEQSLALELSDGTLPLAAKIRVFEILCKKETDISSNVLNVLSKALESKNKANEVPAGNNNQPIKNESTFTQEEYNQAKNALLLVDKIAKGEFSPEEFFQKKEK